MEGSELVANRHRWLLERLAAQGRLITNDAAALLGVSVDTVRRDLRTLHTRGLLRRVHGGAMQVSPLPDSFTGRSAVDSPKRSALAAAVVDRFRSGQLIGLDAGSTNVEVAAQVPQTLEITIVTNSPAVALTLVNHRSATVVLLGGTVDLTWMATTGPETVDAWRDYNLDMAVLGVCGFDPLLGASTRSHNEVGTKRALAAAAAETLIPVQAEKMGTQAPFQVLETAHVDTLIVESGTSGATIKQCRAHGVEVVTA